MFQMYMPHWALSHRLEALEDLDGAGAVGLGRARGGGGRLLSLGLGGDDGVLRVAGGAAARLVVHGDGAARDHRGVVERASVGTGGFRAPRARGGRAHGEARGGDGRGVTDEGGRRGDKRHARGAKRAPARSSERHPWEVPTGPARRLARRRAAHFPEVLAVAIPTAAEGRAQWYITQKSEDMRGEDGRRAVGVSHAHAPPRPNLKKRGPAVVVTVFKRATWPDQTLQVQSCLTSAEKETRRGTPASSTRLPDLRSDAQASVHEPRRRGS